LLKGRAVIITFLVTLTAGSCFLTYRYCRPFQKYKIKNRIIRINPSVKVDPTQEYHLRLWDYDWPLAGGNYRDYLKKEVRGFNQLYPRIKVEIRLLDLLTGPDELARALDAGRPPDVYCSALTVPEFDLKYQVPVGPFLPAQTLQSRYFSGIRRLTEIDGVQCFFPRWARVEGWVGNRNLLEQAGCPISQIQTQGWRWTDLLSLKAQARESFVVVGKVIPDAVLDKILSGQAPDRAAGEWRLLRQIREARILATGMLEDFVAGRVPLLAGVKPIVFRRLRERLVQSGQDWEPVYLPAPSGWPERRVEPVELGVISVYHHPRQGGYRQVAAAIKLGEYLSRSLADQAPWEELMLIPAARNSAVNWFKKTFETGATFRVWEAKLTRDEWCRAEITSYRREKATLTLQGYLTGKFSRRQAIARLREEMNTD
jgi:hypothetical protein